MVHSLRRILPWVLCLTAIGFVPAGFGGNAAAEPVRGVTISTHTDGTDWAFDGTATTMKSIRDLGADWVAIHPYAGIRTDGAVRAWSLDPENPPEWIRRPIREAHALGLKILIKPHLAYWGTRFTWRGAITFETEAEWDRFWSTYRRWIVDLARACRKADGFVVGTELDRTIDQEGEWRELIREVRAETGMPLTYAANWSDFEQVGFWDALDVIGIQAYFPIVDSLTVDTGTDALREGWNATMGRLRSYAEQHNRKIIFTELGYNRSYEAPVQPWAYRTDGRGAEKIQQACLRTALEAIEKEPDVLGAFLWKWFPEPHPVGRNFQLATPELIRTIRSVWGPASRRTLH